MALIPRPALVVALALLVGRAGAEVYRVMKEGVPRFTLLKKHLFYVDTKARGREGFDPQAVFEDFHVTSSKLGPQEDGPSNLQVGLIPWEDFDQIIDKAAPCNDIGEVVLRDPVRSQGARMLKVPFGKLVSQQVQMSRTGVYVAVLSNCGPDDLKVTGAISVMGSNGFLPANSEGASALFGWCLALYIIAGLVWAALLAKNKEDLHAPHYAIASLIACGVGEAVCYRQYLSAMGDTDQSWAWLEKLCQSIGVMKTAYMFAVIMLLCLGVGLAPAGEHLSIKWKLVGATTLFSAALVPKVCAFDCRHAKNLSDGTVILSMIPAVLATFGSIAWGSMGISSTMAHCQALNRDDALELLQRLAVFVGILLTVAAGIVAAQVFDKPGRGALWWQYHEFWGISAGETVHFIAVVFLMVLCQPGQAVFKADADMAAQYEAVVKAGAGTAAQDEEGEHAGLLDADELQDEERGPQADTIGAPAAHTAE